MIANTQQVQQPARAGALMPALPVRRVAAVPSCSSKLARSRCRAEAAQTEALPATTFAGSEEDGRARAFPYPQPMDPTTKQLSNIPQAMFYPALLAFIGGSAFVGSVIPKALPLPVEDDVKQAASLGAAAVLGAGAAYASVQAKKKRDAGAVTDLYNSIVDLPDPSELTSSMVDTVGRKYGINMHKDDLDGLVRIYGQYVENLIPTGDTQLRGDEAQKIRAFKDALGLEDEEAAPAHVDVARRLYRSGFETKDRFQQFEQRKGFQRLVYVSSLVFGDAKAAYLLPWRRHFNLTEAQLFVARRDNAKTIFRSMFEAQGGNLRAEREFLREVKAQMVAVRVMDESGEEVVREYSRRQVEARISRALDAIKATGKNKDNMVLVAEVASALEYSRALTRLKGEEDMPPGLGPVSIAGGTLAVDGKQRELRELYKAYLDVQMERAGQMSEQLDGEAQELQAMLCLSAKEAQVMRDEVAAKLYRRLLREEVTSGRLDKAESPAAVLEGLVKKVRFSKESAVELHKQLYRAKMASLVDKGKLTAADREDMVRIRRILCLPEELARKVDKETTGRVLESVIDNIFLAGAKPVPATEMARVEAVVRDLSIDSATAVDVLASAARDRLKTYITQAQKDRGDQRESVSHLKKMLQFNQAVVTPLLWRLKGQAMASPSEGAASDSDDDRRGQSEITLREDVDERTRGQVYKDYMMHMMTGDTVDLPVGGTFRKKGNSSSRQAESSRLSQLAALLGMTQEEVATCTHDMAEHAFKAQVSEVMRGGPMTAERSRYVEELRVQLGVSKELGEKVLKATKSEVYGSAAALEEGGRWTLERMLDVHKAGGNLADMVEESIRRNIYRKELERSITDGSGELNSDFILKKLPYEILGLDPHKIRLMLKELVSSRKRMLMVQAVSQHRQKRPVETVSSLQNLLSCVRVMPEKEPMQWSEKGELRDIFAIFCSAEASPVKREELRSVLGLTEDEATALSSGSESDTEGPVLPRNEDDSFF